MTEEINRWTLESDIKKLATACSKVKGETARKKAIILYEKYANNIYSTWQINNYNKYENAFNILKSGKLRYNIGKQSETIFIKDVIKVKKNENDITLIMINNEYLTFKFPDFDYLDKVF